MDSVVFDGKEYVKASVLATRFRYTQDYLGQLCRGKKVDARLVGRAWYVNLESLEAHRTGRYKTTTKSAEISPKKPSRNYLSRIDVEPVLKNKTVKIFKEKNGKLTELPVRYEKDEYSLIPRVNKTAISSSIPVLPAEAERLKIKKEAKKFSVTDFKAEALPEVFLSGSVKVDGIPEAIEEPVTADITKEIKPERKEIAKPQRLITVRQPQRRPKGARMDMRPVMPKSEKGTISMTAKMNDIAAARPVVREEKASIKPVSTPKPTNRVVQARELKFSPDVIVHKKTVSREQAKISNLMLALLVFLSATLVSLVVLLTKQEVLVDGGSYADNFSLDTSIVPTILDSIFR